ncbi:hypothetical protein [Streptomyces sp. DHE17-7]|uniref:hypothetical protein n=1 Tax=Streptomyces sp. DHE17-7 TaxID=2759949 RepID=UPI002FCE3AE5
MRQYRDDALNPDHRFASMPSTPCKIGTWRLDTGALHRVNIRLEAVKTRVRELLGYPYPARIPKGVFVEQWVGISTDEFHRAKDADVKYMRNRHPLLAMSWSWPDVHCGYLTLYRPRVRRSRVAWDARSIWLEKGNWILYFFFGNSETGTSGAHVSAPSGGPSGELRDAAIRQGNARANASGSRLLGEAFLHRSRVPLSEAPIDHVTAAERAALRISSDEADVLENGVEDGCSPWACRGDADALTRDDFGLAT